MLTPRALRIIHRVDEIIHKCQEGSGENPTEDEQAMYEVFASLRGSPIGPLFIGHPEVSLSNRSCVITTPDFGVGESINGYTVWTVYNPGTIGRSFVAVLDGAEMDSLVAASTGSVDRKRGRRASGQSLNETMTGVATVAPAKSVLKVVCFVLRKSLIEEVIAEQRVLVNMNYDTILKIHDVLNDEYKENMITMTEYHPRGSIAQYAGRLDNDPDRLRRILHSVGMALRSIHSHRIYHHDVKLDNVLETENGNYCLSDCGFAKIFLSQCPEALVFNGELACLPPEVFEEKGRYADAEVDSIASGDDSRDGMSGGVVGALAPETAKVDVWGFGVLMYRLAYGLEPVEIVDCAYDEVKRRILNFELSFPKKPWPFAKDLEEVIMWCMDKDPKNRPTVMKLLRHPLFKGCAVQSFITSAGASGVSTLAGRSLVHSVTGTASTFQRLKFNSSYSIESALGKGRVSEALLVHLKSNPAKQFVFKLISRSVLKCLREIGRGADEVQVRKQLAASRKMDHPNVLNYLDIVEGKAGDCFVVEGYIRTGALAAIPPVAHSVSPNLIQLLYDVLLGLIHLHDNGIADLCLTPSNIFYNPDTSRFAIADFGPLFLTPIELAKSIEEKNPIYCLPSWLQKEKPLNGFHVDTFCLGLLAASAVPEVFQTAWKQLRCAPGTKPLSAKSIVTKVRESPFCVPPSLVAFVRETLLKPTDARALLRHAVFDTLPGVRRDVPVVKIAVTAEEEASALRSQNENRDEQRVINVLGQDPLFENKALTTNNSVRLACEVLMEWNAAGNRPDTVFVYQFSGSGLRCGQCGLEIVIALYRCPDCSDYIRCGKCAVTDAHHARHKLAPFIIYSVEHNKDGKSRANLFPPSCINDVHTLETLEMGSNLPSGALSGHISNARAMERSMARSVYAAGTQTQIETKGVEYTQPDWGRSFGGEFISMSQAPETDLSVSEVVAPKPCAKLPPPPTGAAATPGLLTTKSARSLQEAATADGVSTLQKASMLTLGGKKFSLPKAEDVEDNSWEQELEQCRRTNATELLLYNFNLSEIPTEVYSPPPLQVVVLDVSQNSLTHLPHELSFLVHLRKLVVSYNKLTELPDSIGNLSELTYIDASHNELTDLPASFMYLSRLEYLAMDYNDCTCVPECVLELLPPPTCPPPTTAGAAGQTTGDAAGSPSSASAVAGEVASASAVSPPFQSHVMEISQTSPALSVIYLAANARITTFPAEERLRRFDELQIALDNEPTLYKYYMDKQLDTRLPNVTISWNKIYPDEIIPNLFCGSLRSAQSQMVYRKLHITYVLTVGRGLMPVPPEGGVHKTIIVDDIPGANILFSFQEAVDFIDDGLRRKQGCLVHCFAGLSRSATTVIAYLMIKKGMRLDEAYLLTKKGRPAILPNKGFFDQLVELDHELYPKASRPLDIASLDRPES